MGWMDGLYHKIAILDLGYPISRFPKIGLPTNHPFIDGCSIINHPAIGVLPFMETPNSGYSQKHLGCPPTVGHKEWKESIIAGAEKGMITVA